MHLTPDDLKVCEALAQRGDDLVERAVAWSGINSGSRNREGLEIQLAALKAGFAKLAGELELLPLPPSAEIGPTGEPGALAHPDALRLTVRPKAALQVVLTGHYDTVYPAHSPFQSVSIRPDGALGGPGIADMKGGLSVMLGALEAFETHPLASELGYVVLLSPDEEIGSPASAALLSEVAAGGHIGLTYEPCMPDGALAGARKGSGNFHLSLVGREAHAGRDFDSGRNALAAAAEIAAKLHALNGRRDGATFNIAKLDGGGALNVVPGWSVLRFNVRAPDGNAQAWCVDQIAAVVASSAHDGVDVVLHGGFSRPPKPVNPAQQRLLETVRDVGALLGQSISWRSSGGVCEGNNLFAAGLPNIDTLGVRGGNIHSEDEYAWPQSFPERAMLSAVLLMKVASGELDARSIRALQRSET
jgi:glutamate carboxypeptidase